ncbi:MAG: hypothetical protein ABIP55_14745, partial [Tepidisphaeraceae bacterium]
MMLSQEMIFAACLFATVAAAAFALSGFVFRKDPLADRIRGQRQATREREEQTRGSRELVVPFMERVGHVAARPFMPRNAVKRSSLRKQLMHAGIYSASAMELIVALKVILLGAGVVIGYLVGLMIGGFWIYLTAYVGALVGFFLPALWLRLRIKS